MNNPSRPSFVRWALARIRAKGAATSPHFAARLARCLLAAGVLVFGFLGIGNPDGPRWDTVAIAFLAAGVVAVTVWMPTGFWIRTVVSVFIALALAPRWFVPEPAITEIPGLTTGMPGEGWIPGAAVVVGAVWFESAVIEPARREGTIVRFRRDWRR